MTNYFDIIYHPDNFPINGNKITAEKAVAVKKIGKPTPDSYEIIGESGYQVDALKKYRKSRIMGYGRSEILTVLKKFGHLTIAQADHLCDTMGYDREFWAEMADMAAAAYEFAISENSPLIKASGFQDYSIMTETGKEIPGLSKRVYWTLDNSDNFELSVSPLILGERYVVVADKRTAEEKAEDSAKAKENDTTHSGGSGYKDYNW